MKDAHVERPSTVGSPAIAKANRLAASISESQKFASPTPKITRSGAKDAVMLGILNAAESTPDRYTGLTMPEQFRRLFAAVQAPFEYRVYEVTEGVLPESAAACDAYLVTGSRAGVYDPEPWITPLADFIRRCFQAGRKVVGVCFGHQVVAEALGGRAEKSMKGWGLGLRRFHVSHQKAWMEPWLDAPQLYFAHQDQVTALPPGAELLAGNAFCPNATYTLGDRVLGLQGHPEIPRPLMAGIIEHLRDERGQGVGDAAETLDHGRPDAEILARWIVNFLHPSSS